MPDGLRVWGYCTQHSKDTLNTDSCIMWMESGWVIKKQSNNHPDTNVGNIEYISKQDAVNACQEGWNNSVQDCINNIKALKPSDVVKVRDGKWKKIGAWGRVYRCTQCGNFLDFDGVNAGRGDTNFCPNCGAKMDKE